MKNIFYIIAIILVGALLGNFFGKAIGLWFPPGNVRDLFATQLTTGLQPSTVDLVVVNLTFGCMFKFNITGIIGIAAAALLSRSLFK